MSCTRPPALWVRTVEDGTEDLRDYRKAISSEAKASKETIALVRRFWVDGLENQDGNEL